MDQKNSKSGYTSVRPSHFKMDTSTMAPESDYRKLCAVMFTDIAGYSSMTQSDEAAALRKVSLHRKHLETCTAAHHGKVVQFYGDGSLSIYDSVIDAVRCAIQMQHAYQQEDRLPVKIAIHLGDIIFTEDSVFGDGVNIAARIQEKGLPGSVLLSDKVVAEIHNHTDIQVEPLGTFSLKNIAEPVSLYAISNPGLIVPQKRPAATSLTGTNLQIGVPLLILALAILFIRLMSSAKPKDEETLREDRIAIPEFLDLTNHPEYGMVSKIAAHYITRELIESGQASVVSYQSAVENNQNDLAAGANGYSARTGAVNVVQGAYVLRGPDKDTLELSATILHLETGELLNVTLDYPRCPASDPMECIRELASSIMGFWQSRSDLTFRTPHYDAYKLYLQARDVWFKDDELADSLLRKCIEADPAFIDAYFLLLDGYYNRRQYDLLAQQITEIKQRFPKLTPRQKNYLAYYEADNQGRTLEAYQYFLNEYQTDPKDLFINTSGMVMAGEYLNSPEQVLKFFAQIPADSLDLSDCRYCEERWSFAIYAYHALGKTRQARRLADQLKTHVRRFQNFQRLIEFYIATGDTATANAVLHDAERILGTRYGTYLSFIAGRQAMLKGDFEVRDHYAQRAASQAGDSSRMRARCAYLTGHLHRALEIYEQALFRDSSDARIYGELGLIYARLGDSVRAEAMIGKLEAMKEAFDFGNTPYSQGRIAANLGDRYRALALLRRSLDEGNKFLSSLTYQEDPDLQVLHDDPEFQKMLRRI